MQDKADWEKVDKLTERIREARRLLLNIGMEDSITVEERSALGDALKVLERLERRANK